MTYREIYRRFVIAYAMTLVTHISVTASIMCTLEDGFFPWFLSLVSAIYHGLLILRFENNLTDAKGDKC